MEMHKEEKITLCRLCFKQCDYFEVIEDATREILRIVIPELDLAISQDPVMCKNCSKNLKVCYDFKSGCLHTEDCIRSFADNENDDKLDLRDIYLSKNDFGETDEDTICRLCMELVKYSYCINLSDEEKDVVLAKIALAKFFPELDINITKDPVICTSCHKLLEEHHNFISHCLNTEQIIKQYFGIEVSNCQNQVSLNSALQSTLKVNEDSIDAKVKCEYPLETETQELGIKQEEVHVKLEPRSEQSNIIRYQSGVEETQHEIRDSLTNKGASKAKKYKCESCTFTTNRKRSLQSHMLLHRDASEKIVYKCHTCDYETKLKRNISRHMAVHRKPPSTFKCHNCGHVTKQKQALEMHMLTHRAASEVTEYECASCTYKTKYKHSLRMHVLVHKDTSQVIVYHCELCPYKTKYKYDLKVHTQVHKNSSERPVYLCEICSYKAKHKCTLKRHMLSHRDASEIKLHKCDICSYEFKQKSYLTYHMLTHKDDSEVTMFKCQTCTFETKYKRDLRRHMLTHKDVSELTMHKCQVCLFETKHKGSLKQHMDIHKDPAEVKEYGCQICTFKTKYKSYLKKHTLTHVEVNS